VPQGEPTRSPLGHEILAGLRERDQDHPPVVRVGVPLDDPVAGEAVEHGRDGGGVEISCPGQLARWDCILAVESEERPQLRAGEVAPLLIPGAQPSFRPMRATVAAWSLSGVSAIRRPMVFLR